MSNREKQNLKLLLLRERLKDKAQKKQFYDAKKAIGKIEVEGYLWK